jgi:hypothetical protein
VLSPTTAEGSVDNWKKKIIPWSVRAYRNMKINQLKQLKSKQSETGAYGTGKPCDSNRETAFAL